MSSEAGKIILLNGASSSGKSSLAVAIRSQCSEPFWHISIDHLLAADILPRDRIDAGEFNWTSMREPFFEGFHRCLPALSCAGNNLIVEHIIETPEWMERLVGLLGPMDVFLVGLHCPLPVLEMRERTRGDRRLGDARRDFETIHEITTYDFTVCTTESPESNAARILEAWDRRRRPLVLERAWARGGSPPAV